MSAYKRIGLQERRDLAEQIAAQVERERFAAELVGDVNAVADADRKLDKIEAHAERLRKEDEGNARGLSLGAG